MPNRHIHSNLKQLFNIIYCKQDTEACLISLDVQRAYDQIDWPYLFSSLKEFGIGDHFLRWVKILYAKPKDSVITNQTVSYSFRLHGGTRQGCPLSPYLFAIAMKPIAMSIRKSPYIAPISIEDMEIGSSKTHFAICRWCSFVRSWPRDLSSPSIRSSGNILWFLWDCNKIMPLTAKIHQHFLDTVKLKIA